MIVSTLCKYYDIMLQRGDVCPDGYSTIELNYLVCLNSDGTLDDIIDMGEQEGKKKIYKTILVPRRTQKPGIEANIVEHRPLYLFGLASDQGKLTNEDNKAKKSHKAFVEKSLEFFENINSQVVMAFCAFIRNWDPEAQLENALLTKIGKDYDKSRYGFCLTGRPDITLHGDPEVRKKWEAAYARILEEQEQTLSTCSVLGKELPVAVLHDKIKGIKGGQASGCKLICVNNVSEESYGKAQGGNCCISKEAMQRYTAALNFLLEHNEHHTYLDDMTIVHFALEKEERHMLDFVNSFIFGTNTESQLTRSDVDKGLKAVMEKIEEEKKPNFADERWDQVDYCIIGLVPNSSRIAIKFSWFNTFGFLRKNIEKYHNDFSIGDRTEAPPLWRIKKEALVSPKSREAKVPSDYMRGFIDAMLDGAPFPSKILQTAVSRVKTDSDTDKDHYVKLNETRAGIIKACLARKNNQKEKFTMALNCENRNSAYLCGRLFAVLEKIQQDSAEGKLNKTIIDTYFASACSTPAEVFPRLFKLSQAHLAKIKEGTKIFYDKKIGEIADELTEFPKTQPLEEQGNFILGYYQQKKDLYTKKTETEEN